MEREITQREVYKAMRKLRRGKTPGQDRLPSEFYEKF